jgi:hypothetical protein
MSAGRGGLRQGAGAAAIAFVLLLSMALRATAHDFWLVPDAFRLAPGSVMQSRGQTSSLFPTSESAVAPDRVVEARLVAAAESEEVRDFSRAGTSLLLRHRPTTAGQRVLAVRLAPRFVRESPASFRRYMELEGAPELLDRYERDGLLPPVDSRDSITRSYEKYAKAVLEVGNGPRAFDRLAGHPLEITPLADPSALRLGDTLTVQVRFRGAPLANAHLHAGSAPDIPVARADTGLARRAGEHDLHLVSDAHGSVRVHIRERGIWNVRTLYIVPGTGNGAADWEVHWATLVFLVGDSPRR